jgi:hypothetical protein
VRRSIAGVSAPGYRRAFLSIHAATASKRSTATRMPQEYPCAVASIRGSAEESLGGPRAGGRGIPGRHGQQGKSGIGTSQPEPRIACCCATPIQLRLLPWGMTGTELNIPERSVRANGDPFRSGLDERFSPLGARATRTCCDADNLWVVLSDGRQLSVPPRCFPRLLKATEAARRAACDSPCGDTFPKADEHQL